jgi:hypothetical protein
MMTKRLSGFTSKCFLHIDIPEGYVRLDERDEEYRENVVKSFYALPAN